MYVCGCDSSHANSSIFYSQPAFYEAFGLTVVEAMTCGLPTLATCHGGPAEIIEDRISGFHIDPYHPDKVSAILADFFQQCKDDPSYWEKISKAGLQRILERFVFLNGIDCSTIINRAYQVVTNMRKGN